MAEEPPARGIDPVGTATEIDAVQIEFEDLILAEALFERERKRGLLELARGGFGLCEEDIACELLRDRGGTLPVLSRARVDAERARNADRIDAGMAVEAPVFDRDHRCLHRGGDRGGGQPLAIAGADCDERRAVRAEQLHGLALGAALEFAEARHLQQRDGDPRGKPQRGNNGDDEAELEQAGQETDGGTLRTGSGVLLGEHGGGKARGGGGV